MCCLLWVADGTSPISTPQTGPSACKLRGKLSTLWSRVGRLIALFVYAFLSFSLYFTSLKSAFKLLLWPGGFASCLLCMCFYLYVQVLLRISVRWPWSESLTWSPPPAHCLPGTTSKHGTAHQRCTDYQSLLSSLTRQNTQMRVDSPYRTSF